MITIIAVECDGVQAHSGLLDAVLALPEDFLHAPDNALELGRLIASHGRIRDGWRGTSKIQP
jgi:hypothetical protein